jgi:hypothetical protein
MKLKTTTNIDLIILIIFYISIRIIMRTIDLNLNPGEPKNIQNYKEKASKLFEKLNTLQ